jgi:N-acetylglucosamine malate deacetylase 1
LASNLDWRYDAVQRASLGFGADVAAGEKSVMAANPYLAWVETFVTALRTGEAINTSGTAVPAQPPVRFEAPKALIFAPHPDDEMITGALPLRLMRERGFAIVDVAVTLGSRVDRRAQRWRELEAACAYLGFALVTPDRTGLEGINLQARERNPASWDAAVSAIADVLAAQPPDVLFLPHAADWNATHIGVHHLVVEAMRRQPSLACRVVETEYWGAMTAPNLMVESTPGDVADLVAALSLHAGEVARNPYHLRMPAWMIDNVRRGAELVGGQGSAAPPFAFATLYRLRGWKDGQFHEELEQGRAVASTDSLEMLFPPKKPGDG